jgi:hypothetical protein
MTPAPRPGGRRARRARGSTPRRSGRIGRGGAAATPGGRGRRPGRAEPLSLPPLSPMLRAAAQPRILFGPAAPGQRHPPRGTRGVRRPAPRGRPRQGGRGSSGHGWRPRPTGRRTAHDARLRAAGAVPDRRDWSSGWGTPGAWRAPTGTGLSDVLPASPGPIREAIAGPSARRAPKPPGGEGRREGIRCGLRPPVVGLVGLNPRDHARADAEARTGLETSPGQGDQEDRPDARGPLSGPGSWHAGFRRR